MPCARVAATYCRVTFSQGPVALLIVAGPIHRREFVLAAAGVAACVPLQAQTSRSRRIGVRFRTQPELLARLLPPGFEQSAEPLVEVEMTPSWARVAVSARFADTTGWLPIAYWTSEDRERLVARERLGFGAVPAEITFRDGGAHVAVNGQGVLELVVDPGRGEGAAAEQSFFAVRFSAPHDWTQDPAPAEVLQADTSPSRRYAADAGGELTWLARPFPEAASELPVLEILHAWSGGNSPAPTEPTVLGEIPGEAIAAWAPLRYPRPSLDGVIRRPEGWPERATALRLTDEEQRRWRARKEVRFDTVDIIEINAAIDQEVHAALAPPPCSAGSRPLIKIMGLRIGGVSENPFNELWLMSYCRIGRVSAWYTLAHIVGPGGDVVYGREAFGYPSKPGDPEVVVTPVDCSLVGRRKGKEFFYADGGFGGFSTGTTLGRFNTLHLRVQPGHRTGDLVLQPWTYQGRRRQVTPLSRAMDLPHSEAAYLDPWHDLRPFQLGSISALETGLMQRGRGQIVATVESPDAFYRERCDGILPWEDDTAEPAQPTFLVEPGDPAS